MSDIVPKAQKNENLNEVFLLFRDYVELFFSLVINVRVDGSGHAESRQNVFDDFICSAVERMDCFSFVVMLEGGVMHGAK